jgi:hypothetical protein
MNSNVTRTIHSAMLATMLLSTASVAVAGHRRYKGVSNVVPVQRVIVREHSSAGPAVAALIGGFIIGSAFASSSQPVIVHEPVYYSHPVVVYRYWDPYAGVWYDSLDECQFRYHHPRLVYVVDVNSGRHIRSLRFHAGAWHRMDG